MNWVPSKLYLAAFVKSKKFIPLNSGNHHKLPGKL